MGSEEKPSDDGANPGRFRTIHISTLRVDSVTGFDLYIQTRENTDMVLYRQADLSFSQDVLERLKEHGVQDLYIPDYQEELYYKYIEENLESYLLDQTVDPEEKSQVLYDSTQHVVREILDDPKSGDVVPRSERIVKQIVNFMFSQESAFANFLKVSSHDYSTYTHSVNVFVYSITLAERVGMTDPKFLNDFGLACLLHDIGKSLVDREIIHCKGALSSEQWRTMKKHPVWGYGILKDHGVTSEIILDVTLHHHEKLRGGGYPDGLKGDEIKPHVRIATICDIFDALTTQRSYKDAVSSFPAFRIMQDELMGDLDPDYFKAFIEMMSASNVLARSV